MAYCTKCGCGGLGIRKGSAMERECAGVVVVAGPAGRLRRFLLGKHPRFDEISLVLEPRTVAG